MPSSALLRDPVLRRLALAAAALAVAFLGFLLWLIWPFWQLSGQFAQRSLAQPSRLYGRAPRVEAGALLPPARLVEEIEAAGYREAARGEALVPGRFRKSEKLVAVYLRPFPTRDGVARGGRVEVEFAGRRVQKVTVGGEEVSAATLEPPLLHSYYGPELRERRPVAVDELPEEVVQAVLAAEDDRFFRHGGLSLPGILRAAWVNLRGGEVRQGGSTLTQQLVKNLYLTHERTLARKAQEAVLALLLELRYDKRDILQAYLNEVYWGRSGTVSLIGIGAAARAYFGKEAAQLDLGEAAALAGMIRSPGEASPVAQPERARARRDWVLDRLAALGWVEGARLEAARAGELRPAPIVPPYRQAPYFADAMVQEARARFGAADLEDAGYTLLSTLSLHDQERAEEAVAWGLQALEKGWQKGKPGRLQSALVSVDPRSGEILAYVGGRDYGESQFDRAGQARRQAGSAFKPVVYAAAFEARTASPATLLEDAPLTVTLARSVWTPRNDDDEFHGWVSARLALEESYNVATARLGLQTGLERVVELARALGIQSPLRPVPALALGAFEVTPLELATVYATLANGGARPALHGLAAVLDPAGAPLAGGAVPEPEAVLSPEATYLLNSILQGVLDRGTGASVRAQGVGDALAGKTGTTNGSRDSWFAGYAPSRTTLVWVGYDDNSSTRLSGARAALPIWGRFTAAVRPPGGYPMFPQPRGISTAAVDPETGELATERCPRVLTEVFLEGHAPRELCHLHGGWFVRALAEPPAAPPGWESVPDPQARQEESFRTWLRRVLGRRDPPPRRGPSPPR
jgi:penicillin-binding protein 1B